MYVGQFVICLIIIFPECFTHMETSYGNVIVVSEGYARHKLRHLRSRKGSLVPEAFRCASTKARHSLSNGFFHVQKFKMAECMHTFSILVEVAVAEHSVTPFSITTAQI
ncbi:uncharacterized protein LOC144621981 [Crassostrea virginica]